MKLIPTILCGGAGSRLWPVSRELHPKPFIRLADGQSLLQKAWLRGAQLGDVGEIVTVTNRDLLFKTQDEYQKVSQIPHGSIINNLILEPFGRNTAPAIAAAALKVVEIYGEDALLLVLAADHLITHQAAFSQAVDKAARLAEQGKLVTFGIKPESPETAYGYIEANTADPILSTDGSVMGYPVLRFVEKPDLERAKKYIATGNYQWNSGMFCFAAGVLLREMELHCPAILEATRVCMDRSITAEGKTYSQVQLDSESFGKVPDNSIDFAVMEKSNCVAVVPCSIGWSDIGSWDALGNLTAPDNHGNRIEGEAVFHDVSNCFVRSSERLICAVGVSNLIVIDTPDALLVTERSRAQDVKHLYARLKASGHEAHKLHREVYRPWGAYTVLESGANFKIKRIEVKPGASLSLQMHYHRSEHWIVVSGTAKVVNGHQEEYFVNTNESTYIPATCKHRVENPGVLPLVMIEVQSGAYLGEDDIVRFDVVYGRNVEDGAESTVNL